jgi:hypothetical protein
LLEKLSDEKELEKKDIEKRKMVKCVTKNS